VTGWGSEGQDYDFDDGGFSEETGHFTQLVWKETTSVGCGRVDCGDGDPSNGEAEGWYVVCEYHPAGNVEGEYQREVQPGPNSAASPKLGSGQGSLALGIGFIVGGMFIWL
jgi:hypothetical protein